MKTTENLLIHYLFNPHRHLDGWKAFTIGLFFQILATLLAYLLNGRFDGILDYHFVATANLGQTLMDQSINIAVLWLVFGGSVAIISRGRNRWSDVLGLLLLARAPVVFLPLLNLGDYFRKLSERLFAGGVPLQELPSPAESFYLLLFSLFTLAILIWWLVLLFRVYRLLIHKTGTGYTLLFIGLVVFAEYLSKTLLLLLQ